CFPVKLRAYFFDLVPESIERSPNGLDSLHVLWIHWSARPGARGDGDPQLSWIEADLVCIGLSGSRDRILVAHHRAVALVDAHRQVRIRANSKPWPYSSLSQSVPGDMRPRVVLRPTTPHQAAGWRREPPASLPWASGKARAARRALDPALDPPVVSAVSHGLCVGPLDRDSAVALIPNSGQAVRPSLARPARLNRVISSVSCGNVRP